MPTTPLRFARLSRTAVAATAAAALVAGLAASPPMLAHAQPAAAAGSPAIASGAPWTPTVAWLVSQLTPSEQVSLIYRGTDPDNHGEAGYLAGVPRLGIPEQRHADAQGINVRADATAFPTRIGLASSFDRQAYQDMGVREGEEGIALDVDVLYGPQVDLARYPSWSRNLTTNGEDAYLSSEMAVAEVEGIQSEGLMAEVKHVGMYSGQSNSTPSLLSSQAARELHLAPAEAAITQAGAAAAMCSYASFRIVGEEDAPHFACSNANMQNEIVKSEWGFTGFITSDYGGAKATSDILSGMDNEFRTSFLAPANLVPLIDETASTYSAEYAAAVDEANARMLYQYERFGLLDNSRIPAQYQSAVPQHGDVTDTDNSSSVDRLEGQRLALDLALKSGVLMKNDDGTLPLSSDDTVAVVGPTSTLLPAAPSGERARGFGDRVAVTPLKAMRAIAGSDKVVSAPGIDLIGTTVPTANLRTADSDTAPAGLVRTTTEPNGVTTTSVDTTLDGKQSDLVRGNQYTWTGYVDVTTADTYQLLLQRPYGLDSGDKAAYNEGVSLASAGTVTLDVDGTRRTLATPDANIIQNEYPDGATAANGQYLGKDSTGVSLPLSVGRHQITINYAPAVTSATAPTLRFAWAPLQQNTDAAVAAAEEADTTVIFVDDYTPATATEPASTAGGPNASTSPRLRSLHPTQADLITTVAEAAHAAGKEVTVVLNSGGAVAMPWADEVDAVLEMWFPGQEGGPATAQLLYGEVNPSGKLPITFPTDNASTQWSDHPERTVVAAAGDTTAFSTWSEGVNVGYRWYTDPSVNTEGYTPAFAFGSGLSYTTFAYSGLSVTNAADGGLDATFTVSNTGSRAGAEVPQLYLGPSPDLEEPTYDTNGLVVDGFQQSARKLVQFERLELGAGQSRTTTLHIEPRDLSAWDTKAQQWVLGTGARSIMLAAASDDIRATVVKDVPDSVTAPIVTSDLTTTVSAAAGQDVTLSAAATGRPQPTQQWQRSTNAGATWTDIAGATGSSYTFRATAADDGAQIRATFVNDLGTASTRGTTIQVEQPQTEQPPAPAKVASTATLKTPKKVRAGKRFTVKIVVDGAGAATPTGTVVVKAPGRKGVRATLNSKGVARVSLRYPKPRTVRIRASYRGDSLHAPSTDSAKVKIRRR